MDPSVRCRSCKVLTLSSIGRLLPPLAIGDSNLRYELEKGYRWKYCSESPPGDCRGKKFRLPKGWRAYRKNEKFFSWLKLPLLEFDREVLPPNLHVGIAPQGMKDSIKRSEKELKKGGPDEPVLAGTFCILRSNITRYRDCVAR